MIKISVAVNVRTHTLIIERTVRWSNKHERGKRSNTQRSTSRNKEGASARKRQRDRCHWAVFNGLSSPVYSRPVSSSLQDAAKLAGVASQRLIHMHEHIHIHESYRPRGVKADSAPQKQPKKCSCADEVTNHRR